MPVRFKPLVGANRFGPAICTLNNSSRKHVHPSSMGSRCLNHSSLCRVKFSQKETEEDYRRGRGFTAETRRTPRRNGKLSLRKHEEQLRFSIQSFCLLRDLCASAVNFFGPEKL